MALTGQVSAALGRAVRDLLGLIQVATVRASIDPGSIAAEASGDVTVTVTGALPGDFVLFGAETDILTGVNLAMSPAFVSVADTVTLHLSNNNAAAGAAIDVTAFNAQITVMRRQ